ncbi:MAG: hypothetical protein ACR2RL_24225 [Gammaproteobacteria bacterium]
MAAKVRDSSKRGVENLIKWINRQSPWDTELDAILDEHTEFACDTLDVDRKALLEGMASEVTTSVLGCALEDLFARRYEGSPANVVDDYLKRRSWREGAPGRRYLEGLRDSVLSVYEVVDVKPGRYVDVRDLIRSGDPVRVNERAGSRELVQWDRLAARVMPHLGKHIFSGVILPFSQEGADNLCEALQKALDEMSTQLGFERGDVNAETAVLRDLAPLVTSTWLSEIIHRLTQPLPEVVNFDGEPLQFSETHFEIKAGRIEEIIGSLDAAPGLVRDSDGEPAWTWLSDDGGNATPAVKDAVAFDTMANEEGPMLGSIRIERDHLLLTTNSLGRTDRGKAWLTERVGDCVGVGLTSMTNVEQMLAAHADQPTVDGREEDIPLEDKVRIEHAFFDQHYRRWLDESIPALDGQSPRQAAASEEGRPRLVSLLKQFENREAHRDKDRDRPSYDCTWLWDELGVAHLRN